MLDVPGRRGPQAGCPSSLAMRQRGAAPCLLDACDQEGRENVKIGFLGMGRMGTAMAVHLLRQGHELTVWNRSAGKAAPLLAVGARWVDSPAEAAQGDVVMTMLADDAAVEAVVYGEQGVLGQPALHVSHSTISLAMADRLARDHGHEAFLSAPVFGRPSAAQAAKLFVIAAGGDAVFRRAHPALQAFSQSVIRVGTQPSQANVVKLGGNFMIVALVEALAEAMQFAQVAGVGRGVFSDAITQTILDVPLVRTYGDLLAKRAYRPAGFPAVLGLKDMGLVSQAAERARLSMPVLAILRAHLGQVLAGDDAGSEDDLDLSAMALATERNAAVPNPLSLPQ